VIETLPPTPADPQPADAQANVAAESITGMPDDPQRVITNGSEPAATGAGTPPGRKWSLPSSFGVAMAIVVVAFGWSYATNLRYLYRIWNQDPNYSHGFLVVPVALIILWQRWVAGPPPAIKPSWWGWVALAVVLALRAFFYERGSEWSETATLLPVIACLTVTVGGWSLLRRVWPAIAFLVFLFPLPQGINSILSQPLQNLATVGSGALLKLTGLWVVDEGNVILVGPDPLEVAAACNGLSMLMCLAATVAAMTLLIKMETWKQVVLLASIIPIALISNVLRITATAWCYHLFGAAVGGHVAHDAAGWLMMPMALVLVGLELGIMSRLIVAEEEVAAGRPDRARRRHAY
jgi:exosortase